MSHDQESGFMLQIPPHVKLDSILAFLEQGHGYRWLRVSRAPVVMALGSAPKSGLPDLAIVNSTLYAADGSAVMCERFGMMLDLLERQSRGGR